MAHDESALIIVSSDGHVSGRIEQYAKYLPPEYRKTVFRLARENEEYLELFGEFGRPDPEDWAIFDTRDRLASGGDFGCWDVNRRLEELDSDGIAAELILYGTQFSTLPFFATVNRSEPVDLRWAGAKAYNRWVAEEMLAPADGRLLGCMEPGPCHNLDETITELAWAKDHGFVSVLVPGATGDPTLPPLTSRYWDPFWAACDDLGIVIAVHAGWGRPQGAMHKTIEDSRSSLREMNLIELQKQILALDLGPRSVFWKLVIGGAFDRHPGLKLALVELRSDWLPATLSHLDEQLDGVTPLEPSEYFNRNCFVVPSAIHRAEVAQRHQVGLHNLVFGVDYPHYEGTWPNTLDWIRDALGQLPEAEARAILGENAIEWFGLDRAGLAAVAERIGPRPSDVFGVGAVAPELVGHFDKRAAYLRPAEEIDSAALTAAVAEDLAALATANGG